MTARPPAARIVIVGGGIAGLSAAWHLAEQGISDVLLLERAALSSGTTWHSTGNMETYRADPLAFDMVRYAAALYPRLAQLSDMDIGWRVVGRVMYTDREDRWALFEALPALGRARGIDIELLERRGLAARLPILDPEGLLGGIWVPGDARVNPTDAVTALARLVRRHGVRIAEHTPVQRIEVRHGAVHGVVTEQGLIDCETVVLAAGLWSARLAATCGAALPLHALEHQYVITEPCGIGRDLPLFLSYDDQLYGREEVGGLIVGSLDDQAIAVPVEAVPDGSFCLLSERWEQFEPYMATAMRRFPLLREAGVRMLLNGPESFTPDGQMLLGPVPAVSGLYAACGFNSNGMALAPAAGRFIAEWILEGAPSADVAALDVRRFADVQSTRAYLEERVTEIPGHHCRIAAAGADYATARRIRCSPLHDAFAAAGARFVSVNGWERAAWCEEAHRGPGWEHAVPREFAAAQGASLIVDRSADATVLLCGRGAAGWADAALPPLTARSPLHRLLPGAHGGIEALVRLLPERPDRCRLSAGPEQETRLREWLRTAPLPDGVQVVELPAASASVEIFGPRRGELLGCLAGVSPPGAPAYALSIGSVRAAVYEDSLHDSVLVRMPAECAGYVWRRLQAAVERCAACIGGHWAAEALRISRGIPAFGSELSPALLVSEITAGRSPTGRLGGDEVPAKPPRTHRQRRLLAFAGGMEAEGFGVREVIFAAGQAVGELTSRVRLPGWSCTLALGLVDLACADAACGVMDAGRLWPLGPRDTGWNQTREGASA